MVFTPMTFTDILSPDSVLLGLDHADSDGMLAELAAALTQCQGSLAGRQQEIRDAMAERESQGSTAQQGVAIPHIKLDGVDRVSMVVGVHTNGLDFQALDGEHVHVFFALLRPVEQTEDHLDLLRCIASVANHRDFVPFAKQAENPAQIIDLLAELSTA